MRRWQLQVRARARVQAAATDGIVVDTRALRLHRCARHHRRRPDPLPQHRPPPQHAAPRQLRVGDRRCVGRSVRDAATDRALQRRFLQPDFPFHLSAALWRSGLGGRLAVRKTGEDLVEANDAQKPQGISREGSDCSICQSGMGKVPRHDQGAEAAESQKSVPARSGTRR